MVTSVGTDGIAIRLLGTVSRFGTTPVSWYDAVPYSNGKTRSCRAPALATFLAKESSMKILQWMGDRPSLFYVAWAFWLAFPCGYAGSNSYLRLYDNADG